MSCKKNRIASCIEILILMNILLVFCQFLRQNKWYISIQASDKQAPVGSLKGTMQEEKQNHCTFEMGVKQLWFHSAYFFMLGETTGNDHIAPAWSGLGPCKQGQTIKHHETLKSRQVMQVNKMGRGIPWQNLPDPTHHNTDGFSCFARELKHQENNALRGFCS